MPVAPACWQLQLPPRLLEQQEQPPCAWEVEGVRGRVADLRGGMAAPQGVPVEQHPHLHHPILPIAAQLGAGVTVGQVVWVDWRYHRETQAARPPQQQS